MNFCKDNYFPEAVHMLSNIFFKDRTIFYQFLKLTDNQYLLSKFINRGPLSSKDLFIGFKLSQRTANCSNSNLRLDCSIKFISLYYIIEQADRKIVEQFLFKFL